MQICLVTTSQPSANPRLVKEADALVEAGYDVHVLAAHRVDWATAADPALVATRGWRLTFIDWRRDVAPVLYWKSRIRNNLARHVHGVPMLKSLVLPWAIDRLTPELTAMAKAITADVYVAHNPGALPAAAAAARAHGALLGFDAEDFHSGEFEEGDRSALFRTVQEIERRFVPQCHYVTAASPGIADAYAPLSTCGPPTTILNVFPLKTRPSAPVAARVTGPLRLYWFSQTIGHDRGLEAVVSAMGRLGRRSTELHLQGRWQDGYEDSLRGIASDVGVSQDAIIWHPPASSDELVRIASTFDVGLATETGRTLNRRIALTNKIFTYVLAGIATLATRTPAQAALVSQLGQAAQSYDPENVEGAAGALGGWIENRSLLDASRLHAWALGESRYNWDIEKEKYLRIVGALAPPLAISRVARAAQAVEGHG
ncbi:MAG: hypothetical protein ACRD2N_08080 [Vicinamibacterales bacterium]